MQVSGALQFAEKLSPFLPNLTLRFKDRHKQKTSAPSSELGSKLLLQLDSSSEMNIFTKRKLPHSQRRPDWEETHPKNVQKWWILHRKGGSGFTSKEIGSEDQSSKKGRVLEAQGDNSIENLLDSKFSCRFFISRLNKIIDTHLFSSTVWTPTLLMSFFPGRAPVITLPAPPPTPCNAKTVIHEAHLWLHFLWLKREKKKLVSLIFFLVFLA